MNVKRWIAGLGAVLLVELAIAFLLTLIAMEENCNNGIPRWQCSESFKDLLDAALIAIPVFYVLLFVGAGMRAWVERRESGIQPDPQPTVRAATDFARQPPVNATRCCGPCSSALGPPDRADRGDRAQVLDQHPVDGESALA
jgi:hypothetical protein